MLETDPHLPPASFQIDWFRWGKPYLVPWMFLLFFLSLLFPELGWISAAGCCFVLSGFWKEETGLQWPSKASFGPSLRAGHVRGGVFLFLLWNCTRVCLQCSLQRSSGPDTVGLTLGVALFCRLWQSEIRVWFFARTEWGRDEIQPFAGSAWPLKDDQNSAVSCYDTKEIFVRD